MEVADAHGCRLSINIGEMTERDRPASGTVEFGIEPETVERLIRERLEQEAGEDSDDGESDG